MKDVNKIKKDGAAILKIWLDALFKERLAAVNEMIEISEGTAVVDAEVVALRQLETIIDGIEKDIGAVKCCKK